jgi:outer membrane protein
MESQPQMNRQFAIGNVNGPAVAGSDDTLMIMFSTSKRKKTLLGLLGAVLMSGGLWAQAPMGLRECIDYSLKHHSLQAISNNEIAIANERVREGLASYLPQVNGSVAFDNNLKRPTTVIPAGTFGPEEIRVQFGNQFNTNAAVQLDQTIYDRGMLLGLKALNPYADLAELNKEKNEQTLMYGTAMAYYAVQIYLEQQKLLSDNESKFARMAEVLKLQSEKGVARKIDYDRVQVTLANIRSQQQVVENEIEMSYNRLKNAMGMPLNEPLLIEAGNWRKEDALDKRGPVPGTGRVMDLYIQEKSIYLQEIEIRRRQAMYLPVLGLYARAGAQAFGNEVSTAFDRWFGYASVGLNLRIPIWNSFRTPSQVKQAQLTLLNARENLKLTKSNIDLQQQNALTQWHNAQENLATNEQNITLAKDLLEVTQLQYDKGVATLNDVLSADYAYKEAQTNYITSLLRVLTARLEYERAQGTLPAFLLQ